MTKIRSDEALVNKGLTETVSNDKLDIFLHKFRQEAIISERLSTFILIGTKTFEILENRINKKEADLNDRDNTLTMDTVKITYEIYCRYYNGLNKNEDNFEFMFNDVTNTERTMEKRADNKYKSLFLSKIAHELKSFNLCNRIS